MALSEKAERKIISMALNRELFFPGCFFRNAFYKN